MNRISLEKMSETGADMVERVTAMTDVARARAERAQRGMRRNLRQVRRRAEDMLADGRHEIQEHPVSAVSLSLAAGLALGLGVGFLLGLSRRSER